MIQRNSRAIPFFSLLGRKKIGCVLAERKEFFYNFWLKIAFFFLYEEKVTKEMKLKPLEIYDQICYHNLLERW